MSRGLLTSGIVLVAALGATQSTAQPTSEVRGVLRQQQVQPPRRDPKVLIRVAPEPTGEARVRREIRVMEDILTSRIEGAARDLTRRIEGPLVAGPFMLSGPARANGYRLEHYGYFFHVDVPTLSQTYLWSVSVMGPPDPAVKTIRDLIQTVNDPREKARLDLALQRIELQLPRLEGGLGRDDAKGAAWVNPNEAYIAQVNGALMDAMLDNAGPLQIPADEWLTVAARGADTGSEFGDRAEETTRLVLRVKGSDLAAFREGRFSREEAKKRIEIKNGNILE